MARKEYTEKQKDDLVNLAQIDGIGRAIKELGYPSYPTAIQWCKARGVTPNVDTIMAEVKKFHTFYENTDAILIAEEGMKIAYEKLVEDDLDADEFKKVSEAFQKFSNQWLALQGRATTISETHKKDTVDLEILDLLNAERTKRDNVA